MRIKKNFIHGIFSWSNTKFSQPTSKELYVRQLGKFTDEILDGWTTEIYRDLIECVEWPLNCFLLLFF